jgi:type IV pilus assembly protein PilN
VARRPENAEVLERSLLLNTLLQRKGISWTKIFSDLEDVIPYNVRLVSVRPEVNGQNEISLQMVVGAASSEPVLELLMALEKSPQFGPTSLHSWLPPSQNEPLYRYRVSVSYAQKL